MAKLPSIKKLFGEAGEGHGEGTDVLPAAVDVAPGERRSFMRDLPR
jgi:hypothetical protein